MNGTPRSSGDGHCTDTLNTLLRSELSAVEAYEKAMARLEDQQVLADLHTIRDEHARAGELLRERVTDRGAEPSDRTGPWSTVAAAVAGTSGMISPTTALWALCQGEQHAINEYEDALKHDGLDADGKQAIRRELLPLLRKHVDELNRLMGGSDASGACRSPGTLDENQNGQMPL
jgi:rubrerythrin